MHAVEGVGTFFLSYTLQKLQLMKSDSFALAANCLCRRLIGSIVSALVFILMRVARAVLRPTLT